MAKKQKKPDPIIMADLSVVSFGDMMTLMLTFFVLLFSMSEIRRERVVATINVFRLGQGMMPFQKSPVQTFIPAPRLTQRQTRLLRGQGQGEQSERISDSDPQHLRFVFGGDDIFSRGSARLSDRGRARLAEFTASVEGFKNVIEIRGHTEPRGLSPHAVEDGHDPWILGYNRAYAAMRCLMEQGIRDERRFRLVSEGDARPVDPRQPARNRRVEVVLTQQQVE